MSDIDEYVTVTRAAAETGYSRVWVRTLAARDAVPSTRRARLVLVHLPSLAAYRERMDARRAKQEQPPAAPPQPQEPTDA